MKRVVLILDDEDIRHETFDMVLDEHDLVHVFTVDQAIFELTHRKFDAVFLDHDLRMLKTGLDVADFMCSMPNELRPDLVVIHSLNPVGAQAMAMVLEQAKFNVMKMPFGSALPVLV